MAPKAYHRGLYQDSNPPGVDLTLPEGAIVSGGVTEQEPRAATEPLDTREQPTSAEVIAGLGPGVTTTAPAGAQFPEPKDVVAVADYNDVPLTMLRDEASARGLKWKGLRKPELVTLLDEDDEANAAAEAE